MIAQSRSILARLDDSLLVRFVDVTEARLEAYFRKELKMKWPDTAGERLKASRPKP